jgi:hypothetical protein
MPSGEDALRTSSISVSRPDQENLAGSRENTGHALRAGFSWNVGAEEGYETPSTIPVRLSPD